MPGTGVPGTGWTAPAELGPAPQRRAQLMAEEHGSARSVEAVDLRSQANLAVYSLQSPTVAGERHTLTVQSRSKLGSAESRRLRKQGLVPGVLYGREEPVAMRSPSATCAPR